MNQEERKALRKEKIAARDSFTSEERGCFSKSIVSRLLASEVFRQAETVLIYKGIRGEVRLEELEKSPEAAGKRLAYPLCISDSEMIALLPEGEDAWKDGYCGIQEPIREKSLEIPPEEIDLVVCPCTVFDEQGGRMGMGAGFYDRFLPKCTNAHIVAVAFEVQKTESVPMEPWDRPMELIFTEEKTYGTEHNE